MADGLSANLENTTWQGEPSQCKFNFSTSPVFIGSLKGSFPVTAAQMKFGATPAASQLTFSLDLTGIKSSFSMVDSQLPNLVKNKPSKGIATFTSNEITPNGENWVIKGELVSDDIKIPVELTATGDEVGDEFVIKGTAKRNFTAVKLPMAPEIPSVDVSVDMELYLTS
jgi:polyisoprenoid-binding protein YceI